MEKARAKSGGHSQFMEDEVNQNLFRETETVGGSIQRTVHIHTLSTPAWSTLVWTLLLPDHRVTGGHGKPSDDKWDLFGLSCTPVKSFEVLIPVTEKCVEWGMYVGLMVVLAYFLFRQLPNWVIAEISDSYEGQISRCIYL